jgi:hypothetical protein
MRPLYHAFIKFSKTKKFVSLAIAACISAFCLVITTNFDAYAVIVACIYPLSSAIFLPKKKKGVMKYKHDELVL